MQRDLPARRFRRLRRFLRRQRGSMLVETVLVVPFLLWGYVALYTYWDAYRSMTNLQKVAYAMSDLISREQRAINNGYIVGIRNTMNSMLASDQQVQLRVTSIMWDEWDDRYEVEWSRSPTGMPLLTTPQLAGMTDRIPLMTDGRTAIIFEASILYRPPMSFGFGTLAGLKETTFREFIVTPPRYAPRIVLQ